MCFRPCRDALKFRMLRRGKKLIFVAQSSREPSRAKIVRFANKHSALEGHIGFQLWRRREDPPTKRKIFQFELLLKRDRVGGHNKRAALVDGVNDSRKKLGQ